MNSLKDIKYLLVVMLTLCFVDTAYSSESADAVLKKVATSINSTSGLTASFSLSYGDRKLSGTLQSAGRKFALMSTSSSTWYDGKNMWTYNQRNNETTLITPTSAEVAEANPLSIVHTYASTFTAAFSKTQIKGCKTIVLTPKSKMSGYKSVHVTIPDGSNFPSKLVVIPSSGQKVTVNISNVKSGKNLPASTFTYPKSKYPGVEIVDLR